MITLGKSRTLLQFGRNIPAFVFLALARLWHCSLVERAAHFRATVQVTLANLSVTAVFGGLLAATVSQLQFLL